MKILYSQEELLKRIEEVANQISKDYEGKNPLFIGVLKGCVIFMAHLLVRVKGKTEIDFMTLSSYKHGTESGELKLVQDLDTPVKDRDIIIVEDIVDTGKTVKFVIDHVKRLGASSVEVVTLVDKKTRRALYIDPPKYVCFEYDQEPFVIGFGFDFNENYRNLPHVYMMEEVDKHQ